MKKEYGTPSISELGLRNFADRTKLDYTQWVHILSYWMKSLSPFRKSFTLTKVEDFPFLGVRSRTEFRGIKAAIKDSVQHPQVSGHAGFGLSTQAIFSEPTEFVYGNSSECTQFWGLTRYGDLIKVVVEYSTSKSAKATVGQYEYAKQVEVTRTNIGVIIHNNAMGYSPLSVLRTILSALAEWEKKTRERHAEVLAILNTMSAAEKALVTLGNLED
jgi:hypothetical protein